MKKDLGRIQTPGVFFIGYRLPVGRHPPQRAGNGNGLKTWPGATFFLSRKQKTASNVAGSSWITETPSDSGGPVRR